MSPHEQLFIRVMHSNRAQLFPPERSSDAGQMSGRFLVIVTGASRGFGRCVAEEFARKVAPLNPVDLVLIARSENGLRSVADSIGEITKSIPNAAEVLVRQEALDLGDMEHLEVRLDAFFGEIGEITAHRAFALECSVFGRSGVRLCKEGRTLHKFIIIDSTLHSPIPYAILLFPIHMMNVGSLPKYRISGCDVNGLSRWVFSDDRKLVPGIRYQVSISCIVVREKAVVRLVRSITYVPGVWCACILPLT